MSDLFIWLFLAFGTLSTLVVTRCREYYIGIMLGSLFITSRTGMGAVGTALG